MACRGCLECLLKILNFLLTVAGLGMVGYGIYLLVEWKRVSDVEPFPPEISPASGDHELVMMGRPMLLILSLSTDILDKLPKAWFIYLFIAVGVVLFVVSCFGCIGAATRNGCCLSCSFEPGVKGFFYIWQTTSWLDWRLEHCLRRHQACRVVAAGAIGGLMVGGAVMGKKMVKRYVFGSFLLLKNSLARKT